MFDERDPEQVKQVLDASHEILDECIRLGGSVTGEHGIGVEKIDFMPKLFTPDDLAFMVRLRTAFNPDGRCSPGKMLPTAGGLRAEHPIARPSPAAAPRCDPATAAGRRRSRAEARAVRRTRLRLRRRRLPRGGPAGVAYDAVGAARQLLLRPVVAARLQRWLWYSPYFGMLIRDGSTTTAACARTAKLTAVTLMVVACTASILYAGLPNWLRVVIGMSVARRGAIVVLFVPPSAPIAQPTD